jgi:uncharacterized glyoxalase superfamily protein PhnB
MTAARSVSGKEMAMPVIRIGDTVVMLADVDPEADAYGPARYGGPPVSLHVYVDDVDDVARRAIAAGAELKPRSSIAASRRRWRSRRRKARRARGSAACCEIVKPR